PAQRLVLANLRIEPCQPATKYKSEMPLPLVLHFASRALKPLWIVLARLHSRESWTPEGTTLKKHKDIWLKFGSCIRKPKMSSAGLRENRAVGRSASGDGRKGGPVTVPTR